MIAKRSGRLTDGILHLLSERAVHPLLWHPHYAHNQMVRSEIAFHEKAGRSQVGSFVFRWTKIYLSGRVCRCRHASIRTL